MADRRQGRPDVCGRQLRREPDQKCAIPCDQKLLHLTLVCTAVENHYHAAFDAGRLRLIPDANLVLVRLMNEIKYQEARLATLDGERTAAVVVPQKRRLPDDPGESASPSAAPPVRPDFQDFYETLERMGAVFRLFGTIDIMDPLVRPQDPPTVFKLEGLNLDSPRRKTVQPRDEPKDVLYANYPVFPPLLVPVSMNLLIYAVKESVEIGPPVSLAVMDETRVSWSLSHV